MRKTGIILTIITLIILASCATSVSYQTTRLPEWNTASIRSVAIVPFEVSEDTALQRHVASLLNSTSYSQIRRANHFNQVQVWTNEGYTPFDAVFTGKVYYAIVNDSTTSEVKFEKESEALADYLIFERVVQLAFIYTLTDSNNAIIGTKTIEDSFTDYYELLVEDEELYDVNIRRSRGRRAQNQHNYNEYLTSPEILVQNMIYKNMRDLARSMVPYTITESRNLMSETSKDKAIKQRAKDAASFVKARNYIAAQEAFLSIYRDTGSYAAAFNVSLIMTAQRQLNEALIFMQNVHNETRDQRAREEIIRLQRLMDNEIYAAAFRN